MSTIYFYTLYDPTTSKPRCAAIKIGDKVTIYDLYRPGAGKSLQSIKNAISSIKDFLLDSLDKKHSICTSNFKQLLVTYDLPLYLESYDVYDIHLDRSNSLIKPTNNQAKDHLLVKAIIDKMEKRPLQEYQKVLANAAVVYQDMHNKGLTVNDMPVYPEWSQVTFSGRSKTSGFNIQGYYNDDLVLPTGTMPNYVLLHFDWIAADIRIASILSNDAILEEAFINSDPYQKMADMLQKGSDASISRDDCKLAMLKAINSMDTSSDVFSMFPTLGAWIAKCRDITNNSEGVLQTVMHRKFKVSQAKNALAVLNGVMQGSVAHAMQIVVRKVWEKFNNNIVAEIHDSLIVASPPDNNVIRSMINIITKIMLNPFEGILEHNPSFPVKVSVGKKWKKWKIYETHRQSGVTKHG